MNKLPLFLLIVSSLFISSCFNNDDNDFKERNEWIRTEMKANYLWNERIPETTDGSIPTGSYFGSMLHPSDVFSYITDTEDNLRPDLIYNSGISPTFGLFSNTNRVFAVVEFVYPGSPAAEAGITRGDIILTVNGLTLTTQNYLALFYQNAQTVTYSMGEYIPQRNTIEGIDELIQVEQGAFEYNPVVYSNVYDQNSHKIGYILYGRFAKGDNNKFIDSVNVALQEMKAAGIDDIIIDLRYNRGGNADAAENLANSLVSTTAAQNGEVFVNFKYNNIIQQRIEQQQGANSDSLQRRFAVSNNNLGLSNVYFLTSSRTSSTSEMLINGLLPHTNVTIVGETTEGAFFGTNVLYGKNATPPQSLILVPVTVKYESSDSTIDLTAGLVPNKKVQDNILNYYPLGDKDDPALKEAISIVTNVTTASKSVTKKYKLLPNIKAKQVGSIIF